jgi:hypothetical protein
MKRFAMLFGTFVLCLQITGCDKGGTGPTKGPTDDQSNLPSEVKEYEARRAAERAAKKAPPKPTGSAKTNAPR